MRWQEMWQKKGGGLGVYKLAETILFHGSAVAVQSVDLSIGSRQKDFGQGFYTTTNRGQAEKFARLKARQGRTEQGFVSAFAYKPQSDIVIHRFEAADSEWFDFVLFNRSRQREKLLPPPSDIIIGPVADDAVGVVLNNFLAGVYGPLESPDAKATALRLLESEKLHGQVFFATAKAVTCLTFQEVYHVAVNK